MIQPGKALLLAEGQIGDALADRLGQERAVRCGDPYEALLETGRRPWPAIVLTAPQPDLAGLCRALRRLQRDAKLFCICPPAAEPDVRSLTEDVLDDYFIYPPADSDLAEIIAATTSDVSIGPRSGGESPISTRVFADIVDATRTVADLEAHLAELVGRQFQTPVIWLDVDEAPAGLVPLLLAAEDTPRVLVARAASSVELDEPRRNFLAALQDCLPSLVATARRTQSLHRLAITDHLTGAYNRRYFYHMTDQVLGRAKASAFRVTLLLFDIDDFKRYNDTYGHAAGDEILRETARLIQRTTRLQDIVARIGGDEFAVLFWDPTEPRQADSQPPESAYVMAERFRQAVARHEFPSLGPEARGVLTISGGLATYPQGGLTCRELLRTADSGLKGAKESGKNAFRLVGDE